MLKKIWLGVGGLSLIAALAFVVWAFTNILGWWAPVFAAGCLVFASSSSYFMEWAIPALELKLNERRALK